MSTSNAHNQHHDQRLDRGLRAIGEHLPEPSPSPDVCARLTRMVEGGQEPAPISKEAPASWGGRLHRVVGALAAVVVLAGLVWMVLTPQAPEPREIDGAGTGASMKLVSFHHDKCPVAREMDPRFKELAGRCRSRELTVQRVDMTAWAPGEARERLESLGLGSVLTECQMPMLTGVVMVVDEAGCVIAQARGGEPLDQVERALGDDVPESSP